jgi:hypothetical protein
MKRLRPNLALMALLFILGVSNLVHFSHNVRVVDFLGLSGGGATCGAAMCGFIVALVARNKARSEAHWAERDRAGSGPQPQASATKE